MNDIQKLFPASCLGGCFLTELTKGDDDWRDRNYVQNDEFDQTLGVDYLYNYYVKDGIFEKYFAEDKYTFCTIGPSLKIGSIYFKDARVRCAHRHFATYEIFKRVLTNLNGEYDRNKAPKTTNDLLSPISVNPTHKDRENIIRVFCRNYAVIFIRGKRYFKQGSEEHDFLMLFNKAFKHNLKNEKYDACLYIIFCLIAVKSCRGLSIYEECHYKLESKLGKDGFIYTTKMWHTSRGCALKLKFDMSTFKDFVANLICDLDLCHTSSDEEDKYQVFNDIANEYIDKITPKRVKDSPLFGSDDYLDEDLLWTELEKLCS